MNSEDIYYAIDFSRIDDEKIEMLANYCNNKKYNSENLYKFFKSVLFRDDNEENRISEKNKIEKLFSLIDFDVCKFDSLNDNQQEEILHNISSILELGDVENALSFITTIKHHLESVTFKIHEMLNNDDSLFDKYIEICNEIGKSSEEVINFISVHEIKCALSKEITDKFGIKQTGNSNEDIMEFMPE